SAAPKAPGLQPLLEELRRELRTDSRDAALAQEIAFGVSRNRLWLEHVLARFLHKPLPAAAASVHEALLMGAYQALFLDRIPARSVVDETVRLVGNVRTEKGYRG